MRRGTTPVLTFEMPFDCQNIAKLHIAFAQNDNKKNSRVMLEKTLEDCTYEGRTLFLTLSEEDTLSLCDGEVEIQIRLQCGEKKLSSCIIRTSVERILKDGLLDDITS